MYRCAGIIDVEPLLLIVFRVSTRSKILAGNDVAVVE